MKSGRAELWAHFRPYYQDRSGKYYQCVYCGEIVHSSERRNHLRYEHPEIWESIRERNKFRPNNNIEVSCSYSKVMPE